MSFVKLTQFYIANWRPAPCAGLDNYRVALDFDGPLGRALLHSFLDHRRLHACSSVGLSLGVRDVRGRWSLQRTVPRPRRRCARCSSCPYALPVYAGIITWSFMLQRDNGLVNHVLRRTCTSSTTPPFWLIGDNAFASMVIVAVWRLLAVRVPHPDGRAAEHPRRALRGRRGRRRRRPGSSCATSRCRSLRPVNLVLLLVLFLWTFNDFNTPFVLFGGDAAEVGRPHLVPHLRQLVRHLELRHRLGDVGAAAAVPAGRDRRLPARSPNRRCPSCVSASVVPGRSAGCVIVVLGAVHRSSRSTSMVTLVAQAAGRRAGRLPLVPTHLTIQPFIDIWSTVPLARYFVNSLVVCTVRHRLQRRDRDLRRVRGLAATGSAGAACSPATVLSTQMFPGILFLLPLFLIFVNIDNAARVHAAVPDPAGLILTYLTFSLPFSIWMLVGYFDSIPRELDEAAQVDGCDGRSARCSGSSCRPRGRASSRSRSTRS